MAFANFFYHGMTRKYVAVFGSLFDQITIERQEEGSSSVNKFIVPIAYGPWQKFLTKQKQEPKGGVPVAMSLPRMSFEIVGFNYDATRMIASVKKLNLNDGNSVYVPVPYNIEFTLSIMTKYAEDLYKIQEQIIPFFSPEFTPSVHLIDGYEPFDLSINMTSCTVEDVYEGDYETRRAILGTMTFTMKGYYFGPIRDKKVIKMIDIDFLDMGTGEEIANITEQLFDKANPNKPYADVEKTDDWGIQTTITEAGPEDTIVGDENGD